MRFQEKIAQIHENELYRQEEIRDKTYMRLERAERNVEEAKKQHNVSVLER
jgi:hypothetical protein